MINLEMNFFTAKFFGVKINVQTEDNFLIKLLTSRPN